MQAWAKVEKKCSDWELVVFGDGNREPYEQQVNELGIDKSRCHLNGPTADIQKEYVNSSVFAFSSRFEGFGMVLVEAMACGLPVVSFTCPCGPKDIIKDEEDGLLVENGNVDALATALLKMMEDDHLRHYMSSNGIRNVQRFKTETIAEQWKVLFEFNQNFGAA